MSFLYVAEVLPGVTLIGLCDDLTVSTAPEFRQTVADCVRAACTGVVADLPARCACPA